MRAGRIVFLFFLIAVLVGCTGNSIPADRTKDGVYKHVVLLDLKDSCTETDIIKVKTRLLELSKVEGVLDLSVTERYDAGDARALKDYDLMLYMEFASEEMLYAYSTDPFHLAVRSDLKAYMAAAPMVIDSRKN